MIDYIKKENKQFRKQFNIIIYIILVLIFSLLDNKFTISQTNRQKNNSNSQNKSNLENNDTTNSIEKLLKRLSNTSNSKSTNYVLTEVNYSSHSINYSENSINELMDNVNALYFKYGFYREDKKIKLENYYQYQNEYISFGNYSSYLDITKSKNNEYTQETWVGTIGVNNGYGIKENDIPFLNMFEIQLGHSYSLDLNRMDIEQISIYPEYQRIFDKFDEAYRFGNTFKSSIGLKRGDFIINFCYEDKLVYPDFKFFNWTGAYLIDNIFQRAPDVFEEELIEEFGEMYPYYLFLYKSFYSFLTFQLREDNSYYPMNGSIPFRYRGFVLGVSILFKNT